MNFYVGKTYADGCIVFDCPSCGGHYTIMAWEPYCCHCGIKIKWTRENGQQVITKLI